MTRLPAAFLLAFPFPLAASALPDITPIAEAQRGTMVTVQGTVERITDEDEFRLTDATGSILVYVGPNLVPADVDEAITVSGFVDDDLFGPKEIYARELTRADGSVVTFRNSYQ